jgi:DNA-binding response OmpR family regulator
LIGRIFIMEDDEEISSTVATLLERRGYKVVTANSLNSAVQILKATYGFHAFIADVGMGDGNGLDFLNMVSRGLCGDTHSSTPFLVVSGHAPDEVQHKLSQLPNFKGYLRKPFTVKQLIEKLEIMMPTRIA